MSEPTPSFSSKLAALLAMAEKVLLALAILGLALKVMGQPGDNVLMIALSGLAGVFFLSGFRPPEVAATEGIKLGFMDMLFSTIAPKIAGIGCAVATIGVLYTLLNMPGSKEMLQVGFAAATAASALIAVGLAQGNERARTLSPFLTRLLPLLGICTYYLFR